MPSSACNLPIRSEEHTSELQSHDNLVCRLLLDKNIDSPARAAEARGSDSGVSGSLASAGAARLGLPAAGVAPAPLSGASAVTSAFFFNEPASPETPTLPLQAAPPI